MKRRVLTFCLSVLMSMVGTRAFSHDIKVANEDGKAIYYNYTNQNTELAVSYGGSSSNDYYNEYTGNVVIPESVTYNGMTYSVTSIGPEAFIDCKGLTSVIIPNSVTIIGNEAFYGCSGLKSVTISNSVTSIGSSAFENCNRLTSVTIPNSVKSIGSRAFYYCSGLNSITIPNSVTSIEQYAFYGCSGLNSITIPNSVTSIGGSVFFECSGLTSITIPNSVTSIGWAAFSGCSALSSVVIEDGEAALSFSTSSTSSNMPFENCPIESLYLGRTITYGSSYSPFEGNTKLKTLTLSNSVTKIQDKQFNGCSGLTSITIPNSVTSIGAWTFQDCSSLESVTIGTGVLSIGSDVFKNVRPAKVIWLTNTPPSGYSNASGTINYVANDQYTSLSNKTVYKFLSSTFEVDGVKYVPVSPSERTCDAIDCTYEPAAENLTIGETVEYKGVKMKVNQVHPYACYSNQYIKDIKITCPGDIGRYAFYNWKALATVESNIGGIIGSYAFSSCSSLKTVTPGEQVTGIGQYCFSGCSKLQGIVIPNAVANMGQYAFQNCTSMKSVKMGTGVETIETYTFTGCSALKDMQIGSNVKNINTYAFNACSSLPLIEIPQSVTNIDNYVFSGCKALKNVYLADRTTELALGCNGTGYNSSYEGKPLFSDCPLDSVYIGGNISYNTTKQYGYSPFYRNTSLRSVHITDQETEISENEFYGCTGLKNVRIGDGVTTIGNWAFSGCSSLDYFQFGASVETIGQEAFSDCVAVTKVISRAATPPACGSQALDDLNKWECHLEVPKGMASTYNEAGQWKEFFFVEEGDAAVTWHKLIYEVDGETYKTVDVAAGAAITPEQAPAKAGFTFAGWTNLPATMPAHDVTVTARYVLADGDDMSIRGDLNNDGFVNMADVTKLIDFILGRTQQ